MAVFVDESWNMRALDVDMPSPGSKIVHYNNGRSREDRADSVQSLALPVVGSARAKEMSSRFALAEVVKPGTYQVFVAVGDREGTPRLALPLKDGDGHRRYRLGTVAIAP